MSDRRYWHSSVRSYRTANEDRSKSEPATVEYTLGGETVLYRHEKTFVSKTRLCSNTLCSCMYDEEIDAKLAETKKVDYDRIGERMCAEMVYVNYAGNVA